MQRIDNSIGDNTNKDILFIVAAMNRSDVSSSLINLEIFGARCFVKWFVPSDVLAVEEFISSLIPLRELFDENNINWFVISMFSGVARNNPV